MKGGGIGGGEPGPMAPAPERSIPRTAGRAENGVWVTDTDETVRHLPPEPAAPPQQPEDPRRLVALYERTQEALQQISDTIGQINANSALSESRMAELERGLTNHHGTIEQLNNVLGQLINGYNEFVRQTDARLTALAQKLNVNARMVALDAAVKGKGPGDRNDIILKGAEAFYEFLTREDPRPEEPAPPEPGEQVH